MSRATSAGRYDWADDSEGRWALAVAWAWGVDVGHVRPYDPSHHDDTPAGVTASLETQHQRVWALVHDEEAQPSEHPRRWRDIARRMDAGLRGLAKVLYDTAHPSAPQHQLPSWRTRGGVRPLPGGGWEAYVGWGSATQQAGTWETEAAARRAAVALRPDLERKT